MRLNRRLATLLALTIGAGTLAGTAWTRDDTRVVHYTCPGGERFTVEFLPGHVRLRTGSGIFALTGEGTPDGERYTDGQTIFSTAGRQARLERQGLPSSSACVPREST